MIVFLSPGVHAADKPTSKANFQTFIYFTQATHLRCDDIFVCYC